MSLRKATTILNWFRQNGAEVSVIQLATALGWPKSSTSRLLKDMATEGLLVRDEQTRRYRVGLMMLELARHYGAADPVLERADAALLDVTRRTGHSSGISILDGADIVLVRSRAGTHPLRVVTPPGTRGPAVATATGRALLARLDDTAIAARLRPFPKPERIGAPRSLADLMRRIAKVRHDGFAESDDEWMAGLSGISVGIAGSEPGSGYAVYVAFTSGQAGPAERAQLARELMRIAASLDRTIELPVRRAKVAAHA